MPPLNRACPANAARNCLTRQLARLETTVAAAVFSEKGIRKILRCSPPHRTEASFHDKERNAGILMQVCRYLRCLTISGS
jgi:hypothetical protein